MKKSGDAEGAGRGAREATAKGRCGCRLEPASSAWAAEEWQCVTKWVSGCGIISQIKVSHLKIKVSLKNVALFTH